MSDNIHVAIRVRPLIKREIEKNADISWETKDSTVIYQSNLPSNVFSFDRVFNTDHSNAVVYQDLCAPIVRSVMEGFNGTIFAYGQTSSGKTYTMMGEYGIIPSAIHDIFDAIDNMPEREFLLRVSYMEIYNENVLDLLSNDPKNLKTLEDTDGVILVIGLEEVEIKTSEEVFKIMKRGERKRRVGDTAMNERSSRSHAIFRMIIESRKRNTNEDSVVNVGQLNLVDLAGSERSGQMGTTGERFQEGININKSLLTLTHVISQLSKGDKQHVSYRDSKLTRILQNSLGGNALTVIICTVTPASVQETNSTLKFASRAKRIKNKPTANIVSNDKALLKRYTKEIKKLSEKLEALQQGDDGKQEILVKELEEKSKQNEDLKQQIQELKEKFVVSQLTKDRSNPVLNRKNRRETWCGGSSGLKRLNSQGDCGLGMMNPLPILQEETMNVSYFSEFIDFEPRERISSTISPFAEYQYSFNKVITEAAVQTEEIYSSKEKLLEELRIVREEYKELQEFTTCEKALEVFSTEETQLLKAQNQQLEIKLNEYDVLLQENNKQKTRINDLMHQIEKLSEEKVELQTAHGKRQEENDIIGVHSEELSPFAPNKLSIFQEMQLTESKTSQDIGVQAEETRACSEVREVAVQVENCTLPQTGPIKQSEKDFGHHLTSSEKVGFGNNVSVEELAKKPLCAISMDDIKSMERDIEDAMAKHAKNLQEMQSLQCIINNVMAAYELPESNLSDKFDFEKSNISVSDFLEKCSQLKESNLIGELQHALGIITMDNEYNKAEIMRLENLCQEKDVELKTSAENLKQAKQKLFEKDDELAIWREASSEKYDLYLDVMKEKTTLQKYVKELEDAVAENAKLKEDLTEKVNVSNSSYSKLKNEFLETVKSLATIKEQFVVDEESLNNKIKIQELDNDKLRQEILTLKQQAESLKEHYKSVTEDTRVNHEQRIASLKARMERNLEEKVSDLKKDLNDQHQLKMEDLSARLQIEITTQKNAHKLENVKIEEKLLASNREFMQVTSESLSQLKAKLKLALEKMESRQLENFQTGGDNASYLSELELKLKKMTHHQETIKKLQQKLELAEKSAMSSKSEKSNLEIVQKLEARNQQLEKLVKEQENMVKQHGSKFSAFKTEFEKEYRKLQVEKDALSLKIKTLEAEAIQLKQSFTVENKPDEPPSSNNKLASESNLKEKENSDPTSTEITYENRQLQNKCKKLEQERNVLYQKLSLCKNEIRRLYDQNESTIIAKSKPEVSKSPSGASTASNLHYQTLLNQKERCIKRLEKENKQFRDYLKAKGHHKVVNEVSENIQGNKDHSATQRPVSSNPSSNETPRQEKPAVKEAFATPSVPISRTVPKADEKKTSLTAGSLPQSCSSATKSTASDLHYDDKNCKQQ